MATISVHLTEQENASLKTIARQIGKTEDELIHEAVDQLLTRFQSKDRRALLRQACGIWKNRTDLPSFESLRSEWDRL